MPKAIHKIKQVREVVKLASQKLFHSELHRGQTISDYYIFRNNQEGKGRRPLWTLASVLSLPRCSSTYINRQKLIRAAGITSASLLVLFAALSVLPVSSKHESAEAIGTESTTTITLTKASADLSLTTVSSDGTFASSTTSEEAKFGVTTTNYTGYTLTIAASDDTQTLVNADTSITTHNAFTSISSVIDEKTFDDASYNGKWGYKPSKINSTTNVGFWPSPTESNPTTLDVTESANSNANNYTIALGARADYTQATGTYSKTMTLAATANPSSYSVTYTDNTGTNGNKGADVTNLPDATTSTTSATSITLSSVTPSRTGYAFNGWCDITPTIDSTTGTATCPNENNKYAAGGTYPINQTTANTITLYATWEVPTYDVTIKTIPGITSVTLNETTCSSTSGCTVEDLEYGETYDLTAVLASGYEFGSWSNNGAGSIADVTANPTTYTVGNGSSTIIPMTTTSSTASLTVNFTGPGTVQSVQVRTGAGASGGTLVGTVSASGGSVSGLVSGAEYYLWPTLQSGHILGGWSNTGSYGYLICSNTIDSSCSESNAHLIIGAGNGVVAINSVAQSLQSTTSSTCTTTPTEVYDTRDNQIYVIQKLADNKCWMMTNLNLGAVALNENTDLTSANTNLSSTITASTFAGWERTDSTSSSYTVPYFDPVSGTDTNNGLPYGTLYNYCAATARTYCYDSSSSSGNAQYDLCPAGWRLPTGGSSGEFQTLYNNSSYNTNAKMRASYEDGGAAFTLAGFFSGSSASAPANQGSYGDYWSSTLYGNTSMRIFYLDTSNVLPANSGYRNNGYSIRCVLK